MRRRAAPSAARNTVGRVRAASDAIAQRLERLRRSGAAAAVRRARRRRLRTFEHGASSASANSLTPVIGARRWAMSSCGRPRGCDVRPMTAPRRGGRATGSFQRGEHVPRRLGQPVGQRLDVPRAAGRRRSPGSDSTRRAGSTEVLRAMRRAKSSGRPIAASNGSDGDRLGTADRRGEAGDRRAQHVHPGVASRHHRRRGHRVLPLSATSSRTRRRARRRGPRCDARRAAWRSTGTGRRSPQDGTRAHPARRRWTARRR